MQRLDVDMNKLISQECEAQENEFKIQIDQEETKNSDEWQLTKDLL